jgi:amidohydrolase
MLMTTELQQSSRAAEIATAAREWRHWLHARPELRYEIPATVEFVATQLRAFGCDLVDTDTAPSGIVALIHGRQPGPVVALRADMDALPILERSSLPYRSQHPKQMHACGHDGHMSMLLGGAQLLCESRDFNGSVALVFQPAEEDGFGARSMVDAGIFAKYGIREIYGLHNIPGLAAGTFSTREGPLLAACDTIKGGFSGQGGHAGRPHQCRDPLLAAAHFIMELQSLVSREVDAQQAVVVCITSIQAGGANNIIPDRSDIMGTVRTLDQSTRTLVLRRIVETARHVAALHNVTTDVRVEFECTATVNHPTQTQVALSAARIANPHTTAGGNSAAMMFSEDFGAMLEACPGAFVFLGNGPTPALHTDDYDFNDDILPVGILYFATVARLALHRLASGCSPAQHGAPQTPMSP